MSKPLPHPALRAGARDHALWAAAQAWPALNELEVVCGGSEPSEDCGQSALPGHRGSVEFPAGRYPLTEAEMVLRIEALEQRIAALEAWHADATGQTERLDGIRADPTYRGLSEAETARLVACGRAAMGFPRTEAHQC